MPRPVDLRASYVPGLDGIRALAVIAVLGYHLGVPHVAGGLLGVGVFFTLSGFLITRILLSSFARTGTLQLRQFWLHRARRLLPGLAVLLAVVLAWTSLANPAALRARWGETWSAAAYVANWHTISQADSYFARFTGPGPLDHLWSLSVEEQFYVVWPLLLVLALRVLGLSRRALLVATGVAAAASFALLGLLAHPGFDNTRAYEGTDTRAGGILVGALLALVWTRLEDGVRRNPDLRATVQTLGIAGLVVIGWLVATTGDYSLSLYRDGLLLLSLATAAVVAAVAVPGGPLGRVLGVAPLRWVGERSYGIYLWQLPLVAAVSAEALAAHPVLWGVAVTALTCALAELSWRLVENPVRTRGFRQALRDARPRLAGLSRPPGLAVGTLGLALSAVLVLVSFQRVAPAGDEAAVLVGLSGEAVSVTPPLPPPTSEKPSATPRRPTHPSRVSKTSCARVVHIGESTSLGLVDPAYLPDRSARLPAQLRAHGVRGVGTDIRGARSIVERWHDEPNAQDAVQARIDDGYHGCWIIAMGTNDAANQAVGGVHPYSERIDLLMRRIGDQPVLWLTVKSLLRSGPYADSTMRAFDDALLDACSRYPNLRVYDWRAEVRDAWFVSDGIHFTTPGYAERAGRIADALARAYPVDAPPSAGCVVGSGRH